MALSTTLLVRGLALLMNLMIVSSVEVQQPNTDAGVIIQCTETCLSHIAQAAIKSENKPLGHNDPFHLPASLSGDTFIGFGVVHYTFSNLKIISQTEPKDSIKVVPGKGLLWLLSVDIQIAGDWKYHNEKISVGHSGSFLATLKDVSISLSITLEANPNGNPVAKLDTCSSAVSELKIELHGENDWLYNLYSDLVAASFKSQLTNLACSSEKVRKNIEHPANFQSVFSLPNKYIFDHGFASSPLFAKGYIQTAHKGLVRHISETSPPPFMPTHITTAAPTRMVTVYLNEYLANTIVFALYEKGLFSYHLTKQNVPEKYHPYFSTSCTGRPCFGTLFPEAATEYPASDVELDIEASGAPAIFITPDAITASFNGNLSASVRLSNGGEASLFRLSIHQSLKLLPSFHKNTLLGTVIGSTLKFEVENSHIGDIDQKLIQTLSDIVDRFIGIPLLNEYGHKGYEIPTTGGLNLVGPSVSLIRGAVVFSTDISYDPNQSIDKVSINDENLELPDSDPLATPQ